MSSNDKYKLFGGMLAATPIDETSTDIVSEEFRIACIFADRLLAIKKLDTNKKCPIPILSNVDEKLVNYMNSPLVDYLIKNNNAKTILQKACTSGNLNALIYLIERGIDYKKALFYAARSGQLEIVKYLNEVLHVDISDRYNRALSEAIEHGHLHVVKYLVESGVTIHDYLGHNALYTACKYNHLDIVKYFIEYGVDDNIKNEILRSAMVLDNFEICKYLIDVGAILKDISQLDIEIICNFGSSQIWDLLKKFRPHNN